MSIFRKAYQPVEGVVSAMELYLQCFEPHTGYDVRVHPYENGREHGFTFVFWKDRAGHDLFPWVTGRYACFSVAKCRNSDQIAIYADGQMNGNSITDYAYYHAQYVNWGKYMEAVERILLLVGLEIPVPQREKEEQRHE